MLTVHQVAYVHPDRQALFDALHFTINKQDKIALTGNNGSGKSTLLRLLAGLLQPSSGTITATASPYYVPQHFGQYDELTVAEALQVSAKLKALHAILGGDVSEANMAALDDDWTIEERCREALAYWQLDTLALDRSFGTLSGGQKTKVLLAGIRLHRPALVLLDEPSNHLDARARALLYQYISSTNATLLVVSHDRSLLRLLPQVYELGPEGIRSYGGNYDFYVQQKAIAAQALQDELRDREKALRKAKETERESLERQQKLDARGKRKQEKAGLPTISMNTLRNNAEKSTAQLREVHAAKTGAQLKALQELRRELPAKDSMKIGFDHSQLHEGKILVSARAINISYAARNLWPEPLSLEVRSGDRIAIKGGNGSGKTSLLRLLLGSCPPSSGQLSSSLSDTLWLDQDYSLVQGGLSVLEQLRLFNTALLEDHELKSRLTRFLFEQAQWDLKCERLSGGEKMRLLLCCLTVKNQAPDLIVLDEPTNNLDIRNTELLTRALSDYRGSLLVVSHDTVFLEQLAMTAEIVLPDPEPI